MQSNHAVSYRNAMESLVVEEVDRQLQRLPARLVEYLSTPEVIAYALNRLPPLYATSEKGWRQQRLRGKDELRNQINTAVRQALIAVQRDPLRVAAPLQLTEEELEPYTALQGLRRVLGKDDLSWETLVGVVERSLRKAKRAVKSDDRQPVGVTQHYDWDDSRYD
ncbi:MAG: late competence development ComFB family protein [Leptolyngbyaceae cyanobacterium CSU_1_3]|nr:late competence development ComFB family protein [Leptolyngbyaceae cyanobacterium CSU_1_3]